MIEEMRGKVRKGRGKEWKEEKGKDSMKSRQSTDKGAKDDKENKISVSGGKTLMEYGTKLTIE